MNINLEDALADSNFHAQKFVNILANSKDAATLLNKYHQDLADFIEKSNERIISSFSKNHTVIMNAAREANLIENEIKDLQNLLVDQSKFISEISTANQILPALESSKNFQYGSQVKTEFSSISQVPESIENQERVLQIQKLQKVLDTSIITRKYNEIPSIINNIQRFIQNFDPALQYHYQSKLNVKISEICLLISNQILNINPILLTDSFSIKSLINILLDLKQSDMALQIYLQLINNNFNKKINNYQINISQSFSSFVSIVITDFFDELRASYKYIHENFSQMNMKILYYLSVEKMVDSIVKNIILQGSINYIPYLDLCDHFSNILSQASKMNEVELDIYKLFRNSINTQIEAYISLYISNHIREIEALFAKHPFIKLNNSLIDENQMEILKIDNSIALCTEDDVIPAICYLDVIFKETVKKCKTVVKSKTIMEYMEKILLVGLNQLVNLVKNSQQASNEYRYTLEYFNKIIKNLKDIFPKSNFSVKNNQLIKKISKFS